MGKKSDNQLYWLGPGTFGYGENALKPNDPLPDSWDDKKIKAMKKRFPKKIGEKIIKGTMKKVESLTAEIENLKKENEELKTEIEILKEENNRLIGEIENPGGKK